MAEIKKLSNIVRIAKPPNECFPLLFTILIALNKKNYNEEEGIKLQSAMKWISTADYLVKLFVNTGCVYEEKREPAILKVIPKEGQPYEMNGIEIILKKIPAALH